MGKRLYQLALGMICVSVLVGCDSVLGGNAVLTESEAKEALRLLPYRYSFREVSVPQGAESAIAGRALDTHGTVLNFGIALGRSADPVPVPRAGTSESYGYPDGGFIFTDDLQFRNAKGKLITNPRLQTAKQFNEAAEMEVLMTDKLCKAVTGEPCPP